MLPGPGEEAAAGAGMGDRRKGAGLLWEVEMDFPLMEGEERAEGGGNKASRSQASRVAG